MTTSRDAHMEAMIDRRVMRILATDAAYRNAGCAEAQAEREAEITRRVEAELLTERSRAAGWA